MQRPVWDWVQITGMEGVTCLVRDVRLCVLQAAYLDVFASGLSVMTHTSVKEARTFSAF